MSDPTWTQRAFWFARDIWRIVINVGGPEFFGVEVKNLRLRRDQSVEKIWTHRPCEWNCRYTVGVGNDGNAAISARSAVNRKSRQMMDEMCSDAVRVSQRHPETLVVIDDTVYYEYDLAASGE